MSTIESYKKIPRDVASNDDLDFAFLRKTGIAYIESMGGGLWSDLNDHDPGVTMLEMLAYAITDLGARLDLPIETILASESDPELRRQFYRAEEILPVSATNALDYRKLFIDIEGVRNCWIVPAEKLLYVDCVNEQLALEPFDPLIEQTTCPIQGLNCVIVDYEDGADTVAVDALIREKYNAHRNLCEDLEEIKPVDEKPISVCAQIDLDRSADVNLVHASILDAIEQYFSPQVRRYSLKEMREKGYRMDEIFEGPLLDNGFIDTEELKQSNLQSEVRLSDIINVIMNVDGVNAITNITVDCCCEDTEGSDWLICLDPFTRPVLAPTPEQGEGVGDCSLQSIFSYKKDVMPVLYDQTLVTAALDLIQAERDAQNALAIIDRFPEIPTGDILDIGETTTIMNDFPETYGIGLYGLPGTSTEARKGQAKQLKGYLLFFDQILATYFAHLNSVKELFAMDAGLAPTYFTQAVKDVRGIEELTENYPLNDNSALTTDLIEFLDDQDERRNEILDHLLARFAESFTDYAFILQELYGATASEMLIQDKETFLSEYLEISANRGNGFNKDGDLWDTTNVSGVQHRVARLSGISNYARRNLVDFSSVDWVFSARGDLYTWQIGPGPTILFQSFDIRAHTNFCSALSQSLQVIESLRQMDSTELANLVAAGQVTTGTEFGDAVFVQVSRDYSVQIRFNGVTVGTIPISQPSIADAANILIQAIDYVQSQAGIDRYVIPTPEEGIFLIEHLLILPSESVGIGVGGQQTFLPICLENCDDKCGMDPYSFRATVVIPGTAERFSDPNFRKFMDNLIRQEMPSHILPRICFIDACQLNILQERWWLLLQEINLENGVSQSTLTNFLEIFNTLKNVYPGGRLFNCESPDDLSDRFVLGRSNI